MNCVRVICLITIRLFRANKDSGHFSVMAQNWLQPTKLQAILLRETHWPTYVKRTEEPWRLWSYSVLSCMWKRESVILQGKMQVLQLESGACVQWLPFQSKLCNLERQSSFHGQDCGLFSLWRKTPPLEFLWTLSKLWKELLQHFCWQILIIGRHCSYLFIMIFGTNRVTGTKEALAWVAVIEEKKHYGYLKKTYSRQLGKHDQLKFYAAWKSNDVPGKNGTGGIWK